MWLVAKATWLVAQAMWGGWLDQLNIRLTQPSRSACLEAGAELGKILIFR